MSAAVELNGGLQMGYEECKLNNDDGIFKTWKIRARSMPIWVWIIFITTVVVVVIVSATVLTRPADSSVMNTVLPPNHPDRIDINSCGGIIFVNNNKASYITVPESEVMGTNAMSCIWIIKSEAKMVNIKLVSHTFYFTHDGFVIGELSIGDEELKCRKMPIDNMKNTIKTPAILQFTSNYAYSGFQVEISPVVSSGLHESQPLTYYVDKKLSGSVIASTVRPESLLAFMATFQNTDNRLRYECTSTDNKKCCESIVAYNVETFGSGGTCNKVPLLETSSCICGSCMGGRKPCSHKTKVVLSWAHGMSNNQACRLNWKTI